MTTRRQGQSHHHPHLHYTPQMTPKTQSAHFLSIVLKILVIEMIEAQSQIGLPRDTLTVISLWPNAELANKTTDELFKSIRTIDSIEKDFMVPTVRPTSDKLPIKQGNYAFRWFETPKQNFNEFIQLCVDAWPHFEKNYDSEIIGLWKLDNDADANKNTRTLLLTRRPNLAVWERSKIPVTDEEKDVRRKLSKRYDLCDWTTVYTTTFLTANDVSDDVRWS